MIYLKSIQLKNFLSHQDSTINFKENTRVLISGMSGSGKSSIVEAIIWCLYGRGRSDNRNLIKHGAKGASVVLILNGSDEDGKERVYRITRTVSDNGRQTVAIIVDKKVLAVHGVKGMQEWIEKDLLKASYILFINSIASPQENNDNFVKQTASKKKELLLEIANTDNYDEYYNKIKDLISVQNNQNLTIETKLNDRKNQLQIQESQKVDVEELEKIREELVSDLELDRSELKKIEQEKEKIEMMVERIKILNKKIAGFKEERLYHEDRKSELNNKIQDLNSVDIEEIKSKVAELNLKKEELKILDEEIHKNYLLDLEYRAFLSSRPTIKDYTSDLNKLQSQANKIIENNDPKCPVCGKSNPKLEEGLNQQLSFIRTQIDDIKALNDRQTQESLDFALKEAVIVQPIGDNSLKLKRNALLGIISALETYNSKLGLAEAKNGLLSTYFNDIQDIETLIELNDGYLADASKELMNSEQADEFKIHTINNQEQMVKAQIMEKESHLYQIGQKVGAAKLSVENIILLKREIKDLEKSYKKINQEMEDMNLLKDAFSPKGIKSIVIDYLVPRLEDKINNILQDLSDFRIQIDTQKEGVDGESIIEGLFLNIVNAEGKTMDYTNYSGGEKMKIDYSINEALAGLSRIKFRILDETISSLDDQMLSSFIQVIEKINQNYKQLIVISHIGQVKDIFEDKMTIIKQNGNSIIQ